MALTLFLLNLFVCFQQPQITYQEFELSKVGRGYSEHIRVTEDSIFVSRESRKQPALTGGFIRKTTREEWSRLVSLAASVKLQDLDKLTSPGLERASDGALHATLTILVKGGKPASHGFDSGRPNEMLQPLYEELSKIGNLKK